MRTKKTKNMCEEVPTKTNLDGIVKDMDAIVKDFYNHAFTANMGGRCHAFIEFAGVMGEFVVVCRQAAEKGIDFGDANTHSGTPLPIAPHNAAYLAEKLNCIYGPALLRDEEVRDAFIETLFGGEFKLVPNIRTPEELPPPLQNWDDRPW